VIAFLAFPKIAEAAYRIRHAILSKGKPKDIAGTCGAQASASGAPA